MMLILGLSPLPFIQTLFGYGNFEQSDASLLGLAIAWQSLQIIPYFARDTMTRVFYAYQDSKTPMLVGLVAIALKALLNYLFIIHLNMGVAGITSSITMITLFNLIVLSFLLKRQHFTSLPVLPLFVSLVKLTLASLPMVGMLWVSRWTLPFLPDSLESLAWMEALWTSILTLGVGGVLYLGACHLLGIQEVQDVMQRLKWRLHKT